MKADLNENEAPGFSRNAPVFHEAYAVKGKSAPASFRLVAADIVYIACHLLGLPSVSPSFRALDPTIRPDSVITANIDALCPQTP
jgi:hypothetical protein